MFVDRRDPEKRRHLGRASQIQGAPTCSKARAKPRGNSPGTLSARLRISKRDWTAPDPLAINLREFCPPNHMDVVHIVGMGRHEGSQCRVNVGRCVVGLLVSRSSGADCMAIAAFVACWSVVVMGNKNIAARSTEHNESQGAAQGTPPPDGHKQGVKQCREQARLVLVRSGQGG